VQQALRSMGGTALKPMPSITRSGVNDPELSQGLIGENAEMDENGIPIPRRRVNAKSSSGTPSKRTLSTASDAGSGLTMEGVESLGLRSRSLRETRVDVTAQPGVREDILPAVKCLRELRYCRSADILKPRRLSRTDTYYLSPMSLSGGRMMPSILKVCSADLAAKEASVSLEYGKRLAGYNAQIADVVYTDDIGLIQLRLPGGVGLLPEDAQLEDALVEYGDKLQEVLRLACEGQTDPFDDLMTHTFSLFDDGLRPCAAANFKLGSKTNIMRLFDGERVRRLLTGSDPEYAWGPDFFDGALETEEYGGLAVVSIPGDRTNALMEVVGFVSGKRQAPSEFYAAFFEAMDKVGKDKIIVKFPGALVHDGLPLRSVVVDASDMLWIYDMDTFGSGHLFTDLASKIGDCIFIHACELTTEEDDTNLRRLLQSLAALPSNLRDSIFPHCPDNATHIIHCVWTFCAQMYCHYINYARVAFESSEASAPGKFGTPSETDKLYLQILWALFTSSAKMVVSAENKSYPMFKRYALFFNLCLAVRLQVEMVGRKTPQWLQQHQALWSTLEGSESASAETGSEVVQVRTACARRIMAVALSKEAWIQDPLSLQTWNVMQAILPVKIQERELYKSDYRGIAQALVRRKRLMIVGDSGSGKTVLTKQVIVHLLSEEEIGQAPRIPVRVSLVLLGHLQARTEQDVLGAYIHEEFPENIAMAVEEARHTLGLLLIFEELDAADPRKFWVFYYLKELYDKEPQHLVLLTTGPAPLEIRSHSRRRYENLVSAWWKQTLYWGFAVCQVQPLNNDHIVNICEARLGPSEAQKVSGEILARPLRNLVQTPLQLTLAIPFVARHLSSGSPDGASAFTSCSDIYCFTLQHLLRHVESAHRRMTDQSLEETCEKPLEEFLMELAYKKQYECESTIYHRDMNSTATGAALWKLARSQQLPLFEIAHGRDHIRFFHQTMQEYLAAMHALSLWEKGSLPSWLLKKADDNVYEIGVHRFFGDLALKRGLCFTEDQHECFIRSGRKKRFQADLVWLMTRTLARGDRLAAEGLFKFLSIARPTVLLLDFSECLIRDVRTLSAGLSNLVHLEQLTISFQWCNVLPSLAGLGEGLAALTSLRSLELDFTGCLNLRRLDGFGEGLCAMEELVELHLNFTGCISLESVEEIGRGLHGLSKLTHLILIFKDCANLESLGELGPALGELGSLTTLSFDVQGCSTLASLTEVGEALSLLAHLRSFSLRIQKTSMLHGLTDFFTILGRLEHLRFISLDRKAAWVFLNPFAVISRRTSCRHAVACVAGCFVCWVNTLATWASIFLYWCFWRFAKVCAACC